MNLFSVIDIETTGGSARHGKITEIAIINHNGNEIISKYSTLLNPEMHIPEFIQQFTGITNQMVQNQPKFFEIAKEILEMMGDNYFVAHNAAFDYSFIKEEFARLGYNFQKKQLCTVKLSRKFFPGLPSYSLGKLCKSLNIEIENRHRALGDADATALLLQKIINNNGVEPILNNTSKNFIQLKNQHLSINHLPEKCGIYFFEDSNGTVIYVGKSINIKKRVETHLQNIKTKKATEMLMFSTHIGFEEIANEEIALLKESIEINKLKPRYNNAGKKTKSYAVYLRTDLKGYKRIIHNIIPNKSDELICTFQSKPEALKKLYQWKKQFSLCDHLLEQKNTEGKCFSRKLNECLGACEQAELPDTYNKRVELIVEKYKFNFQESLLLLDSTVNSEFFLLKINASAGIGWKKISIDLSTEDILDVSQNILLEHFGNNTKEIVRFILEKKKYLKIIYSK